MLVGCEKLRMSRRVFRVRAVSATARQSRLSTASVFAQAYSEGQLVGCPVGGLPARIVSRSDGA